VPLAQKTKSLLVIIVFIAILIVPVCYALIRDKLLNHTEVRKDAPGVENKAK